MRATAAFDRIIAIDGVVVSGVTFAPVAVVTRVRRRKRVHQCPYGVATAAHYDRSTRRWRHLALGAAKRFLETEICRIDYPKCRRVRTEDVPWARPGARHTIAFCAVVDWPAQRTDKTTITTLLRVSWEAVATIVTDVVGDVLDESRFDELRRIGVDEVSWHDRWWVGRCVNEDGDRRPGAKRDELGDGHTLAARYLDQSRTRAPRNTGPIIGGNMRRECQRS